MLAPEVPMWPLMFACREPAPTPPGDDDDSTPLAHSGGSTPTPTGHTGATGSTGLGHTATDPACDALPDSPLSQTSALIETTEDFDFDAQGRLVYVDWNGNLMGADRQADVSIISPGDWYSDARGVQVTSTGEILVNYISGGKTVKVDPLTGARTDYLTGLNGPNALEVGFGDVVYVSETSYQPRVVYYDPRSDTRGIVATGLSYPNGLALSPDQLTLYISDDARGIYAVHRADTETQEWSAPVRVIDPAPGEAYDAMETDVCGNLYSVQFYSGKVYRYNPTTEEATFLVDLDDPVSLLWNAIRWGSNRDGWRRDVLYVTSRHRIFALELGVDGRDQPVDLVP
jgi:sugar lactone lactonase YvrE